MAERNIVTGDSSYLVLIRRGASRYSKNFAFAKHGGMLKALRAAKKWRDETLSQVPPRSRKRGPHKTSQEGKKSGQPVGVSEYIDSRGRIRFSVNWVDQYGKGRIKIFSAGVVGVATRKEVERAARSARKFRREYERACAALRTFDPDASV